TNVQANAAMQGSELVKGLCLPGLPNLHSHSFQRAMAGLAEVRGPQGDSFWTWRQVMYHFLSVLDADDVEAIAAFAFMDMLEGGFTSVGEFHYLHHDINGVPYANMAELSERICAAAQQSGIGLTLLPVLYAYGGIGALPPDDGQKRFLNLPDEFQKLYDGAAKAVAKVPDANIGIAPHSLRAVSAEMLNDIVASFKDVPVHMHISEQVKEVESCTAWSGKRPVEWLLSNMDVNQRWCLIHATHMNEMETTALAKSGATVSLCPLTEASLGDGIFNGEIYARAGGNWGVGTDSNIEITASGELKQFEYSQRLKHQARNIMAKVEGQSTGRALYESALKGGRRALQRRIGALEKGMRCDFVVLDAGLPDFAAGEKQWCDSYLFTLGRKAIDEVYVGSERLVTASRHKEHEKITANYRKTLQKLFA
ncbi:MAG: formimidoylglutamate deiminase, partial [Pseudomonadota bacterium]